MVYTVILPGRGKPKSKELPSEVGRWARAGSLQEWFGSDASCLFYTFLMYLMH